MRLLKFIVSNSTLTEDPSCDFSGLFPGRNDNIKAEFSFSREWESRVKVVAFRSRLGKEYPPQVLNEDNVCQIPKEVLKRPSFTIQILGKRRGQTFETNQLTVYQRGGVK